MYLVSINNTMVTMDESELMVMWSKSRTCDGFKMWLNTMVSDGLIGILG